MTDPKGPKVDLPDELAEELARAAANETTDPGFDADAQTHAGEAAQGSDDPPEASETAEAGQSDAGGEADAESDLRAELEEMRDRHLRLAAEFENFKRRALKERQDLHNYAAENLIKALLATVDNLERALGHARESEEGIDAKAMLDGVELTCRSLIQTLERFGVQVVAAEGEGFDPQVHEAVRQVPTAEHEPGQVVGVLQKGYLLRDRLLRPALVAVSSPASEGSSEG